MKPHNIDTDNVLTMIIIPECSWPVIGQTAVTQPSHWSLSVHSDQPPGQDSDQQMSLYNNGRYRDKYTVQTG